MQASVFVCTCVLCGVGFQYIYSTTHLGKVYCLTLGKCKHQRCAIISVNPIWIQSFLLPWAWLVMSFPVWPHLIQIIWPGWPVKPRHLLSSDEDGNLTGIWVDYVGFWSICSLCNPIWLSICCEARYHTVKLTWQTQWLTLFFYPLC